MVPKTKNQKRVVTTGPVKAPVTLRDVHDHEPDRRRRSALRRLERLLDAPLENMPADTGWFDARFPRDGFDGTEEHWTSVGAYRHWHQAVRSTIRLHALALCTTVMRVRHIQGCLLSIPKAHDPSLTAAKRILQHTDIDSALNYAARFRATSSGTKSD